VHGPIVGKRLAIDEVLGGDTVGGPHSAACWRHRRRQGQRPSGRSQTCATATRWTSTRIPGCARAAPQAWPRPSRAVHSAPRGAWRRTAWELCPIA